MFVALEHLVDKNVFGAYVEKPYYYVPIAFELNKTQTVEIAEVGEAFRQKYFKGQQPSQAMMNDWVQFQTDAVFSYGVDRTIRYFANKSAEVPLFYYTFSVDGALNMIKRTIGLSDHPGASHADVS